MTMRTLVVGCGGGIGSAIVSLLGSTGYEVIGLSETEGDDLPGLAMHVRADLRKTDEVQDACQAIRDANDELWAVVYNAGIYNPGVDLCDYPLALWDEVNNVNLRSAFILLQSLSPMIVSGGRIVTIASEAAHLGSRDVAYSASKSGLLGLTRSFAISLADRKIQVNSVCPGPIDTQMSRRMSGQHAAGYVSRIRLGRFGQPDEVAVAVRFLLDPANTYMTGAILSVNGGLHFSV